MAEELNIKEYVAGLVEKARAAQKVADEIIDSITKEFKCKASPLGSTGKKGKDQTSGDIDIALEYSWEDKDKEIVV